MTIRQNESMDLNAITLHLNRYRVEGSGRRYEPVQVLYAEIGMSGEVVITADAEGPSIRLLMRWVSQALNGRHMTFGGTLQRVDGSALILRDGGFKKVPTGPSMGVHGASPMSFHFYFSEIEESS